MLPIQVLGFTFIFKLINSFSTHFSKCPVSFSIIPIVKLAKLWVLLENLAHIERQSVFAIETLFVCLFVFVALRPMSTAMVIAGQSVLLTTLFPGQA